MHRIMAAARWIGDSPWATGSILCVWVRLGIVGAITFGHSVGPLIGLSVLALFCLVVPGFSTFIERFIVTAVIIAFPCLLLHGNGHGHDLSTGIYGLPGAYIGLMVGFITLSLIQQSVLN